MSLKYRIALVIFILEAIMISAVLWTTSNESFVAAKQAQKEQEDIFFDVLGELSVAALLTDEFSDVQYFFEQIIKKPDVSKAILIDNSNIIVASSDLKLIGNTPPVFSNTKLHYWRTRNVDSSAGILGILTIEFSNEALVVANNKIRNRGLTIAAIGMGIIMLVGIVVGFALTRRLDKLSQAARAFAAGDMNAKLEVTGRDEVAQLGNVFNEMVASVAYSQTQVIREREHFQLLLDSTAEAILGLDTENKCIFVNNACVRMLEYKGADSVIGLSAEKVIKLCHPVTTSNNVIVPSETEMSHFSIAYKYNGESFPVEYWQHPILEHNVNKGTVLTFFDITQRNKQEHELAVYRNHLEELVEKRTKALAARGNQLEVANKELAAFSYSVSHDLRAPLRSVNGFCHALLEDHLEDLNEEGKMYLTRIAANSNHMGKLIDDMLALSRISRRQMKRVDTNLSDIVKSIVKDLKERFPDRKVKVEIKDCVPANVDQGFLKIALSNLLDNAWKYTRNVEVAEITFGCTEQQGKRVYFVKDNGAGFDMRYVDKLFGAFQRLHRKNEFEGTGIGLATVARIIHRHGGEIWAEAEVNRGAAFYFTV